MAMPDLLIRDILFNEERHGPSTALEDGYAGSGCDCKET
jgi:hypothetical protein